MNKKLKYFAIVLASALIFAAIYMIVINHSRSAPEGSPNRTEAFVKIFDTIYHMYPEANSGTCTVVLQIKDWDEVDYKYAINGITEYCSSKNMSLIVVPYGEDISNAELSNVNNVVIEFEGLRYYRRNPENTKLTFNVKKYQPQAAGYFISAVCEWEVDSWECYWVDAREIDTVD